MPFDEYSPFPPKSYSKRQETPDVKSETRKVIDYSLFYSVRRALLEGKAVLRKEWEDLEKLSPEWWQDLMYYGILNEEPYVRCAEKLYLFEVSFATDSDKEECCLITVTSYITGKASVKLLSDGNFTKNYIDGQIVIMVSEMQRKESENKPELRKTIVISPVNQQAAKPKPSPFSLIDLD